MSLPYIFRDDGSYRQYLESSRLIGDGAGYHYRELVSRTSHRKALPPRKLWHNLPATLSLAIELRDRMISRGASGLRVAAAYRPIGGARRSAHKRNAALDLDLLPADQALSGAYYEEAAVLFSELGVRFGIGLGFYGWGDGQQGMRVHIDTRRPRPATWWHHRGKARRSPAREILRKKGLAMPA